jgi:acetate kinase
VRNGQSVDTSMGLTPLAGLVMGTRCGDMDPALPFLLSEWLGMDMRQVYELCNRQSGLLGLSGISNDMRELEAACQAGNERAEMALDVFAYRVIKYVGAYFAVLGRTDAIVFTAGIGERSPAMRRRICQGLQGLGVLLDEKGNEAAIGTEAVISAAGSAVTALVVPTNEELQIAVETYDLVSREGQP